jgi:hypothetical protein
VLSKQEVKHLLLLIQEDSGVMLIKHLNFKIRLRQLTNSVKKILVTLLVMKVMVGRLV